MVDAVVVGAGPNGLAAAIELARAGRSVHVVERAGEIGGGTRTAELTLPGYRHDVCSAIHPLALGSPYLQTLPLEQFGLELLEPDVQAAHPLDDGTAAVLLRSLEETADAPGRRREGVPLAGRPLCPRLAAGRGCRPRAAAAASASSRRGAFRAGRRPPRDAGRRGGFARRRPALCSAGWPRTRCRRSRRPRPTAFALVLLSLGHAVGWPVARGGSQAITEAMRAYLESLGGTVETGREIRSLADAARLARPCCSTPRRASSQRSAARSSRGAIERRSAASATGRACSSWTTRSAGRCRGRPSRAAARGRSTSAARFEEIALSERTVSQGGHPERPYVLVAQQSLVDPDAGAGRRPHAVGVLPCAERVDRRHDGRDRAADRAVRARASPSSCSPAPRAALPQSKPTTRTTSAATSTAASPTCARCSPARC